MMSFKIWLENRIKPVTYQPGAIIPSFKRNNIEKMNPMQNVPPARPYQPVFRLNQKSKSGVVGK
jgi:hypothetical protein